MKTLTLLMLVLAIASVSIAQNVDIPDANFKNALLEEGVDTDEDGEISYAEAEAVNSLDVSKECIFDKDTCWIERQIESLAGIEAFVNLDTIICYENQLTSLDVSGCTALKYLECYGNQLTSLNVSGCKALTFLHCGCFHHVCDGNQLTNLDVSNNTALTSLYCGANQLTSLDVSNNTALTSLYCAGNQLTSLDVSNNTALTKLYCSDNQLTNLDVSNNTSLTSLSCCGNQLTNLDVSNTPLIYLACHNNQLPGLDVSGCTALEMFYCDDNQLTYLDVSNNTSLTSLRCGPNQLTSLDVSSCTALKELWIWHMPTLYEVCVWEIPFPPAGVYVNKQFSPNVDFPKACAIVNIPDANFKNALIEKGVDTDEDGEISYTEAEAVTSLDVSEINISDITGIEAFVNLDTLHCWGNKLTNLDVSKNTALTSLSCCGNQLTNLDVSNNTDLLSLNCGWVRCGGNNLTSLDVSNNTALTYLSCYGNQLTSLDVSSNLALTELWCSDNQLNSLNVSNNTALEYLIIEYIPTLHEVCVWESFPSGVQVVTAGSPNVQFTTDCAVTVLNTFKLNSTIDIYPNPSDDIINIDIEGLNNAIIEIYNVSGRLVFSKALNSKVVRIDISGFPMGVYLLKVRQADSVYVEKVVVK